MVANEKMSESQEYGKFQTVNKKLCEVKPLHDKQIVHLVSTYTLILIQVETNFFCGNSVTDSQTNI